MGNDVGQAQQQIVLATNKFPNRVLHHGLFLTEFVLSDISNVFLPTDVPLVTNDSEVPRKVELVSEDKEHETLPWSKFPNWR